MITPNEPTQNRALGTIPNNLDDHVGVGWRGNPLGKQNGVISRHLTQHAPSCTGQPRVAQGETGGEDGLGE